MKFLLIFLLFIKAHASDQLSIYPRLKEGQSLLKFSTGVYDEDKSYEKSQKVIDLTLAEGFVQGIEYQKAFTEKLIFQIQFEAMIDGRYSETYAEELSFIPDKNESSHGLKEPLFTLYYWFNSSDSNFNHALRSSLRPKLVEPKAHEFYNGRNEFTLSYLYRYRTGLFEVAGEIYSTIYGKKEIRLDSGPEDIIESYTEVGLRFYPGIIYKNFSVHLLSAYASTTDYNTTNASFNRYSDKGYLVDIGTEVKWAFSKNQGISWYYLNKESYFNSIEEDSSRDIEYEIDSDEHKLSWWILF